MMMHCVVEIPRDVVFKAAEEMNKIPCLRKQPVFDLFPGDYWRANFCCGTNMGIGSDNGYGVGHVCEKNCKLRIKPKKVRRRKK